MLRHVVIVLWFCAAVAVSACGAAANTSDSGTSFDAGGVDAGFDAGFDAGYDAGFDAGIDAGLPAQGVLIGGSGSQPGPIAGLRYVSGNFSGATDVNGTFTYSVGLPVTFQVGDVVLPSVSLPWADGGTVISPFTFAGQGCAHSSELEKVLVLLYSLDVDGSPDSGTVLSLPVPDGGATRALASLSLADVSTLVGQLIAGRTALTPAEATDRFVRLIDSEEWAQTGSDSFPLATALNRGQGVASDGTSWWFSGTIGLERTSATFANQQTNSLAIPAVLATTGSNHIGDIDLWNGTLYAPIEDGPGYLNPKVVQYDAQTLTAGTIFTIPQPLQTKGVPWVAVNGAQGVFYLAEWDPATQLNVFTLDDGMFMKSLPIRTEAGASLGRIQGAKVFEKSLYLATDDSAKSVFKLNLETGTLMRLFGVPISTEQEGLAVQGGKLHTLNVVQSGSTPTGSELRHHTRTREPLRRRLCP